MMRTHQPSSISIKVESKSKVYILLWDLKNYSYDIVYRFGINHLLINKLYLISYLIL